MSENQKIADHLNYLRKLATPYVFGTDLVIREGCATNDDKLYKRIEAVLNANLDAVDKAEITFAAIERREADLVRPEMTPYFWRRDHPWHGTKVLWTYCRDQIQAVIDAFNKEMRDNYERYRRACEQGVALSPS